MKNLLIAFILLVANLALAATTIVTPILVGPTIIGGTISGATVNLPGSSVTNSQLANMAASSVKCNNTGAASSPQDCTTLPSGLLIPSPLLSGTTLASAVNPTSINGVTTDSTTNKPVTAASLNGGTLPASVTTLTASGVIIPAASGIVAPTGTNLYLDTTSASAVQIGITNAGSIAIAKLGTPTAVGGSLSASGVDITPVQGAWTPSFTNLTVVNGTGGATYSGTYTKIGRLIFFTAQITVTGSATTASTANSTFINNLPFTANINAVCYAASNALLSYGNGETSTSSTNAYMPTWTAVNANIIISGVYF